jgi:hypothetical protein
MQQEMQAKATKLELMVEAKRTRQPSIPKKKK